jgi:Ca-activated chloride channel family protein
MTHTGTTTPRIEFIPLRPAVSRDRERTLEVLVRITPPVLETRLERPTLNLGLVLDRSGSMTGDKIEYARRAARFALEQLLPTDRVSITIFDDVVETIVPSTLATDRMQLLRALERVQARNSTALHAGWLEGATQVAQHLAANQLNRVILLSDGIANVGETNPDRIANDVHGLARRGVSSTAMGVGRDFNEDLLEAMARAGDGNYHFIEHPNQLPAIFATELRGLTNLFGKTVSLGLECFAGTRVVDVMNDLETTSTGRYKLPNLSAGSPLEVLVRLRVPAGRSLTEFLRVRLAWDDANGVRHTQYAGLTLPDLPDVELERLAEHPEVRQAVALLESARARMEAVRRMDRGDVAGAKESLKVAVSVVAAAPASAEQARELRQLEELSIDVERDTTLARKKATFQKYERQSGRTNR